MMVWNQVFVTATREYVRCFVSKDRTGIGSVQRAVATW